MRIEVAAVILSIALAAPPAATAEDLKPGVLVGISAQVMPGDSLSLSRRFGSCSLNAKPSTVATGASVM